jgi:hypothetical protein
VIAIFFLILDVAEGRVQADLEQVETFAEAQGGGSEGWRGEIPAKEDAAQKRE